MFFLFKICDLHCTLFFVCKIPIYSTCKISWSMLSVSKMLLIVLYMRWVLRGEKLMCCWRENNSSYTSFSSISYYVTILLDCNSNNYIVWDYLYLLKKTRDRRWCCLVSNKRHTIKIYGTKFGVEKLIFQGFDIGVNGGERKILNDVKW